MQQQISAYQQSAILTAMPGDILVSLYDGAIRFIGVAIDAMERRDIPGKGQAINRANAILGELSTTLDSNIGPQLCGQLAALYGYFMERLNSANITMDTAPLREVERHLLNLRDTWQAAVLKARGQGLRV